MSIKLNWIELNVGFVFPNFYIQAKMLEEMDEEFGIGALIEDQFKPVKKEDVSNVSLPSNT